MPRIGDWMQTYTGIRFWPLDVILNEIKIEDIAHALSNICRFNGHCNKFYSVAEHSVYVSKLCPEGFELDGLLDDAAEAYVGDMIRPVKSAMPNYCKLEEEISRAIRHKFFCHTDRPECVIKADNSVLADEAIQCMGGQTANWGLPENPSGTKINFWSPEDAELEFLKRYWELTSSD